MPLLTGEEKGIAILLMDEADFNSISAIEDVVGEFMASGKNRIILDLSSVNHVSSLGFGALAKVAISLKNAGGGLRMFGLQRAVHRVLDILGLATRIEVYETKDEAVRSFSIPVES